MNKLGYNVTGSVRCHDALVVLPGEDLQEAFLESVVQTMSVDIQVTVGDVTMHLAAWQDPAHWGEDWRDRLGCDLEDADEAVAELLASAVQPD